MRIELDCSVDDMMRRWPATIDVLQRYGMPCVDCPMCSFHSLGDVCAQQGFDPATFLRDLSAAAGCDVPA